MALAFFKERDSPERTETESLCHVCAGARSRIPRSFVWNPEQCWSRSQGGTNSRRDVYTHLARRCRRGRLDCPGLCRKKIRLQSSRVLDCGSTTGVGDRLGPRAAEYCGGSTPIL